MEAAVRPCPQPGGLAAASRLPHTRGLGSQRLAASSAGGGVPSMQQAPMLELQASLVRSIDLIGQEQWDACHDGSNPFIQYDFLAALEESGSVVPETGWLPQHLLLSSVASSEAPQTLAVVPLYLKSHSYGEYVFDNSWASAHDRSSNGRRYYPKLQSCVPFTPVQGNRLLVRPGPHAAQVRTGLARALGSVAEQLGVSSLHLTFNTREESELLAQEGFLPRAGIQYHWENAHPGDGHKYGSFEEFLGALQQKRRKSVRQERKKVLAEGLRIRRLTGDELKPAAVWDSFYSFYLNTIDRKWGSPYLTREFFAALSERMSDRVLLVTAEDSTGSPVAGALNLMGTDCLYGRNWGCAFGDAIGGLHFELCYYQAIEHAIEAGLSRVEAGAQGEHKLQRGYLPSMTHSSHFISDPGFRRAVQTFLDKERAEIGAYAEALRLQASPYK